MTAPILLHQMLDPDVHSNDRLVIPLRDAFVIASQYTAAGPTRGVRFVYWEIISNVPTRMASYDIPQTTGSTIKMMGATAYDDDRGVVCFVLDNFTVSLKGWYALAFQKNGAGGLTFGANERVLHFEGTGIGTGSSYHYPEVTGSVEDTDLTWECLIGSNAHFAMSPVNGFVGLTAHIHQFSNTSPFPEVFAHYALALSLTGVTLSRGGRQWVSDGAVLDGNDSQGNMIGAAGLGSSLLAHSWYGDAADFYLSSWSVDGSGNVTVNSRTLLSSFSYYSMGAMVPVSADRVGFHAYNNDGTIEAWEADAAGTVTGSASISDGYATGVGSHNDSRYDTAYATAMGRLLWAGGGGGPLRVREIQFTRDAAPTAAAPGEVSGAEPDWSWGEDSTRITVLPGGLSAVVSELMIVLLGLEAPAPPALTTGLRETRLRWS